MHALRVRHGLRLSVAFGAGCLAVAFAAAVPARAVTSAPSRPDRPVYPAQPVRAVRPAWPAQSVQSLEWWFSAWDITTKVWPLSRGAGVTVAVVDTGVQASLPDIRSVVLPGGDVTGAGTHGMTDTMAPGGHGTGMASLIAGQGVDGGVLGIAPDAKILPVTVGNVSNASVGEIGSDTMVAAGIRYAVDHGAEVINLSLYSLASSASSCDPVLQNAVAYALQHDAVVVAAAGNEGGSGNPPGQPASCAGVLAVGAVGPDLSLWSDSEQQTYVAVSAPGSEIVNLNADGGNGLAQGTSCSSALVSGEAALIRSRYPSMPWYQVVQRIINTALPKGSPVPNDSYGYGIARIPGALNAAKYKVAASAPNPVYAAYQAWLASRASPGRPHPAASSPAAAPGSPGGAAGPAIVIAVVVAVAASASALAVVAARRRRRRQV